MSSQEVEVNVVSSPESSSRNGSPEPDSFRVFKHVPPGNITCFPLIKTSSDDDKSDGKASPKATATQKSSGSTTNFSISSILSKSENSPKKNGYLGGQSFPVALDAAITAGSDSAMLSR